MKRNIFSVIAGLFVAILTFLIFESITSKMYPGPANLNFKDTEAAKLYFSSQPVLFWFLILLGWILGSILCGIVIKRLTPMDSKKLAVIAGFLLTVSAIVNFFTYPHPTWFMILSIFIFVPCVLFGYQFYKSKKI